jgi:hypothetical protein
MGAVLGTGPDSSGDAGSNTWRDSSGQSLEALGE